MKGKVIMNQPIAPYTTYRIGGPADVFVVVECVDDVMLVAEFLAEHEGVPYQVLGGGSNVLYPNHYAGVVIHPGDRLSEIRRDGTRVIAGAGAEMHEVVVKATAWGLGGLDFMAGIPGSIGGAVKGNAGAFGKCISQKVEKVKGFDLTERVEKTLKKDDIQWSYRSSNISPAFFITEVALKLEPCSREASMAEIERIVELRKTKHPTEPSAGSVFVNPRPPDVAAGRLIEELGFKGRRVGDAMCSPRHANFIINLDNATQADVVALIGQIKKAVKERFGYDLAEEIKIITSQEEPACKEEVRSKEIGKKSNGGK
jgi:UDP-N-acetylmuramate dehydrogenase